METLTPDECSRSTPLFEACIDSHASAHAAKAGGARRVELCSALELGGLTPGAGLTEQVCQTIGIPVMMMIRPRGGSFVYSEPEIETMLAEIKSAHCLGVAGVVFGALTSDGEIDRQACERLVKAAQPLSTTFHRAFDEVRAPLETLSILIDLQIDRLLTSGQATTAAEGSSLISRLVAAAGEKLIVIAGGGVRPENVADILRSTGVQEVHGTASEKQSDQMGYPPRPTTDETTVRRLVAAMKASDSSARKPPA